MNLLVAAGAPMVRCLYYMAVLSQHAIAAFDCLSRCSPLIDPSRTVVGYKSAPPRRGKAARLMAREANKA